VKNEEVLLRVREEMNILHRVKRRKANWIGHVMPRCCLLKRVIEGRIEGTIEVEGRQGRRSKQLPDDLKKKREYWKLKAEALDGTVENWLWKFLRSRHETDCGMND
jgi:hypothetical protein